MMKYIILVFMVLALLGCAKEKEINLETYTYTCPVCDFTWRITTEPNQTLDMFYRNILRSCEKHTKEEWEAKEK